ncbi:MAG: zinc-binding dehydrogenase, partial [Lentisphaeria bacterium]|nr:zinc-binding dehydrogenase [Lentisphaeria bacterium]
MKTKAIYYPEVNAYDVCELTLDEMGAADVRVRTLVTAVSPGTERWVLRGLHIGSQFPCVPGYHRLGIVEECGADVTNLKVGDIVYGTPNRWKEDIISMWGAHVGMSVGAAGGYTFVASEPLEADLMESISFTILAGVGNRGINRCDGLGPDTNLLSIGAGIVGITAAQLAVNLGAEATLLDKNPARIAFLKEALPELRVLNVDDPDLVDQLKAIAPNGFDILQDTVGHAPTTDAMVQLMRPRGLMLMQAQYFDKEKCAVDLDQIKVKELNITTTCGIRAEDFEQTTGFMKSGVLKI